MFLAGCNEINNNSTPFELTQVEQRAYSELQKDLSEQHIKDLLAISIAKIYVQSEIDKNYDVTYALYTDKKGHIQWTREEDENIPEAHRGTREQITRTFSNLDQGVFIQTNEFEGYIEYQSTDEPESKSGFQMIKDEDGIWNVAFKPIQ